MSTTGTAVRERGIIFGAEMVRAILDGRKTQTRRIVKPQPDSRPGTNCTRLRMYNRNGKLAGDIATTGPAEIFCPYGVPGERLWVREKCLRSGDTIIYEDDEDFGACYPTRGGKMNLWKVVSPIHMPRWASRITLEIESVRVERVQDISEADAKAEGARPRGESVHFDASGEVIVTDQRGFRDGFRSLWVEIHGNGSWESNPFVWCLTFKRV